MKNHALCGRFLLLVEKILATTLSPCTDGKGLNKIRAIWEPRGITAFRIVPVSSSRS